LQNSSMGLIDYRDVAAFTLVEVAS
jgi:hypothetical protein